jgi:hypothetical protein
VLDDGTTQAVVVCLDVGGASAALVSGIRELIRDGLGVEGTNVLVGASHNHHTQGQVTNDLAARVYRAVKQAWESRVLVKAGAGVGREPRITMNRRLLLSDGRRWTIRRANPSPPDHEVEGLGPVDPEIGVLRLDRMDGRPLAVLYVFAGHAYGGVPSAGVTADFPGFASSVLEEALGHDAVALFLQGAAGDITPVRYKDVDAPPPTEQLGTQLGLSTLKAVNRIRARENAGLGFVSRTVQLPRRTDIQQRIESLESQQEAILEFFTGVGCGAHGAGTFLNFKSFLPLYLKQTIDPAHPSYSSYLYRHEAANEQTGLDELDAENRKRVDKYLECVRQMERLIRIRSNLQNLRRNAQRASSNAIEAEVQGIRVGEFVLVTFPGELFVEVGLRIKDQSPCDHTFVASYANGHLGYAPTVAAYEGEAYEDCLTPFAPEWQAIYETAALELIRELEGGEE